MCEGMLIFASLASSVLFALCFSAWNYSREVSPVFYLGLLLLTVFGFVFNYLRSSKSDNRITNLRKPANTMKIVAIILFAVLSSVAVLTKIELFWILTFATGIIMLVSIDTIYNNTDKRYLIRYHNAQVFLTGLMLASFMISEPLPFVFISILKTLYLLGFKVFRRHNLYEKLFSIVYILFLGIVSYGLFNSFSDVHFVVVLTILLIFELGMRIIFYFDLSAGKSVFELSEESELTRNEKAS